MGKRKWKRVKLYDLASAEAQEKVLTALDQAKGPQEAESPEKRGPDSSQAER